MYQLINNIIHEFRECFKRIEAFQRFVIITIGFMVRSGKKGVTEVISSMRLKGEIYHKMLHYFRSSAYKVEDLYTKWINIVQKRTDLVRIGGFVLLLGDHLKMPKEGRRMPGVATLHQESGNAGKPEYTEGHIFAHVSAVATNGEAHRSMPLMTERQESPPRIEGTKKPDGDTLVTQMINLAAQTAKCFDGERCVIALDAYFAKASAFEAATKAISSTGERLLEIVTRAPTDTVAFKVPVLSPEKKRGRGQPRKYGDKIVLYSLFNDMSKFTETTMILYGKKTSIKYLCLDLIWKPVKSIIRFVLVELNNSDRCVLMSSCLTLNPENIISIYGLRFKIESSFDEQKNDMGCFSYHFWTSALTKRKRWQKTECPSDDKLHQRVDDAKRAIESFVCIGTIATGILTIVAFSYNREIWKHYPGWLRTVRVNIPSIAVVKETLFHDFPMLLKAKKDLFICSIIISNMKSFDFFGHDAI